MSALPIPKTHYTQQASGLRAMVAGSGGILWVQAAGFVTQKMLEEALVSPTQQNSQIGDILIDLREVTGYASECIARAYSWVRTAHEQGVQRIAFVASSSVLRTVIHVVGRDIAVRMRSFESESAARAWLESPLPS